MRTALDSHPFHPARAAAATDYSGQSNLALSFLCLSAEKRADMNVFYTFCRVVDDIADSPDVSAADKPGLLLAWKTALGEHSTPAQDGGLLAQVQRLITKYRLRVADFHEIIAGCEMDLAPRLYATAEDLRAYCYRVASAVGLVSIEIFGYRAEHADACRRYAIELGLALQLTNIIRDVAKDLDNGGRIYLPVADLARCGLTPDDLRSRRQDTRFLALMQFEAARAEDHFAAAVGALPASEHASMLAAEIMRVVYHRLLAQMRRDGFRVFEKNYRLSKPRKLWLATSVALAGRWGRGGEETSAAAARREVITKS